MPIARARSLFVAVALVTGACGSDLAPTTTVAPTTTSGPTPTAAATPTAAIVSSLSWSRVPGDEAVFGGEAGQAMTGVTTGGPGLVAIGTEASEDGLIAAVWTSADGVTWSRVTHDDAVFGGGGNQSMTSVTAGGPGLVAIGTDGPVGDLDAAVWTSPDGVTWSRVTHDEAVFGGEGDQSMTSVTAGGPGLVAVGTDGPVKNSDVAVWTSPDGVTWSRVTHDEAVFGGGGNQSMTSVTAGGPGLVAVGTDASNDDGDPAVWTSPDGVNWSRVPDEAVSGGEDRELMGADRQVMESVTAGGPGLVAVGFEGSFSNSDAAVWTSPDGVNWSRVPHDDAVFGGRFSQTMVSVTAGGPGLVAVGWDGPFSEFRLRHAAVWTSPDGITWSRVPDDEVLGAEGDQSMSDVTPGGPGLVAVGEHEQQGRSAGGASGPLGLAAVWVAESQA